MKNPVTLFISLFILALSVSTIRCNDTASDEETGPSPTDVVTISKSSAEQKMTLVKMSHWKHEERGLKCVFCHHKKKNPDRIKQCSPCHKDANGEKLMHKLCIKCHEDEKQGPVKCKDCHK